MILGKSVPGKQCKGSKVVDRWEEELGWVVMEQVMEGVMVGKRTEEEKCKVIMGNLDSKSNDSNPIVACIF